MNKLAALVALAGALALSSFVATPASASSFHEDVAATTVRSLADQAANNHKILRQARDYFLSVGNPANAHHARSLALSSECQQIAEWANAALIADAASCTAMFGREVSRTHASGMCGNDDDDDRNYAETQADATASCASDCYATLITALTNATTANCGPLNEFQAAATACTVNADCYSPGETCVSGQCHVACTDNNPCDCDEVCDTSAGYCKQDPTKPDSESTVTVKGFLEFNKFLCLQKTGTTTYCYAEVITELNSFDCTGLANSGCCWDSFFNFASTCLGAGQIGVFNAFCTGLSTDDLCAGYTSLAGAGCKNGASSMTVSSALVLLTGAAAAMLSLFRF